MRLGVGRHLWYYKPERYEPWDAGDNASQRERHRIAGEWWRDGEGVFRNESNPYAQSLRQTAPLALHAHRREGKE